MGGVEELSIRKEWEMADLKVRILLKVIENEQIESWLKTRIVLIAKRS